MGSVVLAGATSGSTTITPSATGTYTLTLPAETGTIQTSGSGFTTNGVAYASSTSALATGSGLTFDGTNLGIGTTSPNVKLDVRGSSSVLVSKVTNTNTAGQAANQLVADTAAYYIAAFGSTAGGTTWAGLTGNNQVVIEAQAASSFVIGAFNNAAPIVFAQGRAEVARIDSSGRLLVGTTSPITAGCLTSLYQPNTGQVLQMSAANSSGGCYGLAVNYTAQSPNNIYNEFVYIQDSTALRMSVRSNGGIANYSGNNVNLSDRREKTNFAPATSYLDKICAIPVQTFNYIDQNLEEDGGLTLGVVAQDVQAIAPELVMESNWADKNQEPKMRLSIYQTDLQYALMKSIQELNTLITAQSATITSLTERITALEGK
jgi:hypothetical protein